jgi:hypothetical protein
MIQRAFFSMNHVVFFLPGHSCLTDAELSAVMDKLSVNDDLNESSISVCELGGGQILRESAEGALHAAQNLAERWFRLKRDRIINRLTIGIVIVLDAAPRNRMPSNDATQLHAFLSAGWEATRAGRLAQRANHDHVVLTREFVQGCPPGLLPTKGFDPGGGNEDLVELPLSHFVQDDAPDVFRFKSQLALLWRITQDPALWFSISPWDFQLVTAALLEDLGFQIDLQPRSRDRGIDIIATKGKTPSAPKVRYLVQCKQLKSSFSRRTDS